MRKLKGIILVVLLVASVLMPFNIYADTQITTSNITGCHITNISFSDSTAYNNITCDLDDVYYGYASATIQYYVGSSNSPTSTAYFITVSGNSFDVVVPTSNTSINRQKPITVIQVNDNNIYLNENATQEIMWLYPFESFNFIYYFANNGFEQVGLQNLGDYQFPIFDVKQNTQIFRTRIAAGGTHRIIFFIDKYIAASTFFTYFSVSDSNLVKQNDKILRRLMPNPSGTATYVVYSVELYNPTSSALNYNLSYIGADCNFMPIYYDYPYNDYISTDFALMFGLSNDLLDNIKIIANGSQSSNDSVSEVDSQNEQFESDRDDLIDIEDNFNEDMNDKLDVIDTNTGVSGFGGYFMNSAVWVRTQFDRLTNNTPYGSLIVYGMTLGLALLLLGKVFL